MGRGMELGKNRIVVTKRIHIGMSRDKIGKEKKEELWGKNNRGEIRD
jgi:hypothetical protein